MNTLSLNREVKHALGGQSDAGDVQGALVEFQKSVLARMEALERAADRSESLATEVERMLIKAGRPGASLGSAADAVDRKSLEMGVRALFAGNQGKAMQHFAEAKAMEVGSDPAGGYLVTPQFSSEMTKIVAEISPISALARVIEMTSGDAFEEVVDKDQAEASWVGETAVRSETAAPELAKFRCALNEICAYPKLTQKLIDVTNIDVVTWLQGKVAEAFAAKQSLAFHTGDGVLKPRGFLTFTTAATGDATRAWGQIQHIATGASGAFATATTSVNPADVLRQTVGAMRAQYRRGARWMMNRTVAAEVATFKDVTGRYVWVDSLVPDQPAMLCGYPVDISEDMPDRSANSLSIAFANWQRGYTIIRKPGVRFLVDPYSAPPYVKLHSYERIGGGVNNFEAIKLVKFAAA